MIRLVSVRVKGLFVVIKIEVQYVYKIQYLIHNNSLKGSLQITLDSDDLGSR